MRVLQAGGERRAWMRREEERMQEEDFLLARKCRIKGANQRYWKLRHALDGEAGTVELLR